MYDIIKRPLITEKNTLRASQMNEYAFEVDRTANRKQIKQAIEKLFNVKVERVNTMVCRRDPGRLGRVMGKRTLWKKALVKLKEGDKFDFVAG
ncbi:MAG: 50S ribosomal protein L23 [Bdellovibrionales bacterium]|nr:50S ribosomal protein L23 [Bdellovibrionales bacterium]MCB9253969.1 50S ribosomal protein L23 [Pseudobdellovibrionaceae bacterium]